LPAFEISNNVGKDNSVNIPANISANIPALPLQISQTNNNMDVDPYIVPNPINVQNNMPNNPVPITNIPLAQSMDTDINTIERVRRKRKFDGTTPNPNHNKRFKITKDPTIGSKRKQREKDTPNDTSNPDKKQRLKMLQKAFAQFK